MGGGGWGTSVRVSMCMWVSVHACVSRVSEVCVQYSRVCASRLALTVCVCVCVCVCTRVCACSTHVYAHDGLLPL